MEAVDDHGGAWQGGSGPRGVGGGHVQADGPDAVPERGDLPGEAPQGRHPLAARHFEDFAGIDVADHGDVPPGRALPREHVEFVDAQVADAAEVPLAVALAQAVRDGVADRPPRHPEESGNGRHRRLPGQRQDGGGQRTGDAGIPAGGEGYPFVGRAPAPAADDLADRHEEPDRTATDRESGKRAHPVGVGSDVARAAPSATGGRGPQRPCQKALSAFLHESAVCRLIPPHALGTLQLPESHGSLLVSAEENTSLPRLSFVSQSLMP